MVHYRSFRNDDPPRLAEVWNDAFLGRGAVKLRHSSPLDNYLLAKPYFDPNGLLVAFDGERCVGFVHAGFGANAAGTDLSRETGVVCAIGVRLSHRRRGVGSELLQRCEAYLSAAGASQFYAGPKWPRNPFYFGLYGGSSLPGFLTSDSAAALFFESRGYVAHESCAVLQRQLARPVAVVDGRFAALRGQFEVVVAPQVGIQSRWEECVVGPVDMIEFRLEDKLTGQVAARTRLWEMEGFSIRWNLPSVGVYDLEVREELRRRGLAKFLLAQILRYLQDQFFGLVEFHVPSGHDAALGLFKGLGFEQVDVGRSYRKQ